MLLIPGLHVTTDDENVVFGITAKGHAITDPSLDESGTIPVEPAYYGLSKKQVEFFGKINQLLDDASTDALNAGCYTIQKALGIDCGDVAAVQFSGDENKAPIRTALANYIITEIAMTKE